MLSAIFRTLAALTPHPGIIITFRARAFCLANRLEVVDGKLTGKLAADIVTKESKLIQLLDWAVECGVDMAHTVAIGDGANDIPMIQAAGTGIAFCAKPKTREAAPFAIDERNLMLAMDIILRD